MAAITARKDVRRQEANILHFKVKAGESIPAGALVVLSGGYAQNGTDTANAVFVGVASEKCDNTTGANGDKEVYVWTYGVVDVVAGFSAAQTDVGALVVLTDNQTVAKTSTNSVAVGRVVERLSSSKVRVLLNTGR